MHKHPFNAVPRLAQVVLLLLLAALLGACGRSVTSTPGDAPNLEKWVAEVKNRPAPPLDPLPVMQQFETFEYAAQGLRDPFSNAFSDQSNGSGPRPDPNRRKQTLEQFPLDSLDIAIDQYGPPNPEFLRSEHDTASETLRSDLLKSNCPVTGQPDWASVRIGYRGPRIDHAGLLRYLVSFRDHAEFHEQCVERIFVDLMARCRPQWLWVEARYTRRGGLDINPWRATPGLEAPPPGRDLRQ